MSVFGVVSDALDDLPSYDPGSNWALSGVERSLAYNVVAADALNGTFLAQHSRAYKRVCKLSFVAQVANPTESIDLLGGWTASGEDWVLDTLECRAEAGQFSTVTAAFHCHDGDRGHFQRGSTPSLQKVFPCFGPTLVGMIPSPDAKYLQSVVSTVSIKHKDDFDLQGYWLCGASFGYLHTVKFEAIMDVEWGSPSATGYPQGYTVLDKGSAYNQVSHRSRTLTIVKNG